MSTITERFAIPADHRARCAAADAAERAKAPFLDRVPVPDFTEASEWQLEGGDPAVPSGWTRHLTRFERTIAADHIASGGTNLNGARITVCGTQWGDGGIANMDVHVDHQLGGFAELNATQTRELIAVLGEAAATVNEFGGVRR